MSYRIIVSDEVAAAIDAQVAYYLSESVAPANISAWLQELDARIQSLAEFPERWPIAETVSLVLNEEIRRLNHGEHAVFFRVSKDPKLVEIIAFRHGRQRPWLDPS